MRAALLILLLATSAACGQRPAAEAPALVEAGTAGPARQAAGAAPWIPERWIGAAPAPGARAVLLRFWTDSCPFCERSLPALEQLRRRYEDQGLLTLGVYHPKPPRPVADDQVLAAAHERGYEGPVGVDEDWRLLRELWLDAGGRAATSASFLFDAQGALVHTHPGPEFHPSEEPDHADCDADFRALEAAVRGLLE